MVVIIVTYDVEKALKPYHNIRMMLDSIPRNAWDIFLPENEAQLAVLESNILFFRRRQKEREQVMGIQQLCGFPLRPNESLREVNIKARLAGKKKEKLRKRYNEDRGRSDNDQQEQ